jgi:hypothetical protein
VEEESDWVGVPTATQRFGDWYEMIVVDPNQIIFLDDLFELRRKMIVDLEISAEIPMRKLGEVQTVMQDWPQYPVGEAPVVFFVAFLRKVCDYIFAILMTE